MIAVEHRYFGRSVPDPVQWQYLTVKNAADDMHKIVTAMKTVYGGKWVATGTSKGGQTSLFYKSYYPDDVDATVAYVAPVNLAQEDPRQLQAYRRPSAMRPPAGKSRTFRSPCSNARTKSSPLLNSHVSCRLFPPRRLPGLRIRGPRNSLRLLAERPPGQLPIPATRRPRSNSRHLLSPASAHMRYYSEQRQKTLRAPSQYQAFTEIGYYNYDITDFKPFIKTLKNPTNLDICPPGTKRQDRLQMLQRRA